MNAFVKGEWIRALRSGEYEQTKGRLHRVEPWEHPGAEATTPVGFCCLGVLCDLAVKAGVTSVLYTEDGYVMFRDEDGCGESSTLPGQVRDWAGLDSRNPDVRTVQEGEVSLAALNDGDFPFDHIASLIEAQL